MRLAEFFVPLEAFEELVPPSFASSLARMLTRPTPTARSVTWVKLTRYPAKASHDVT